MPDLKNKDPDLGTKVPDPKLEVPDLRSGGIRLNLTPVYYTTGIGPTTFDIDKSLTYFCSATVQIMFQFVTRSTAPLSSLSTVNVIVIKQIPQDGPKSAASAYFCLYLLNALTKSNIFGTLKQQFMTNTALNDIESYSLGHD